MRRPLVEVLSPRAGDEFDAGELIQWHLRYNELVIFQVGLATVGNTGCRMGQAGICRRGEMCRVR